MKHSDHTRCRYLPTMALVLISSAVTAIVILWVLQGQSGRVTAGLCAKLLEAHPELAEELPGMLRAAVNGSVDFDLSTLGFSVRQLSGSMWQWVIPLSLVAAMAGMGILGIIILLLRRENRRKIQALTQYLESVNTGSAGILIDRTEDDFSHLRDEIYKTVTTLRQTRDDALRARRGFADNLANIAHQLKTPITAARMSLALAEDTPHTQSIQRQLSRLNTLEEALLTLSRIDSGALELKRVPVDVYTALTLAAENLQDLLDQAGVTVEIPEDAPVAFSGDPDWAMEALMNLIKNAMEHSPRGGVVRCSYDRNPLYVRIRIEDQGAGFDQEELPHIFERFYRGKNASVDGVGIGLSLSKSIFELQNGILSAENRKNGGACFEIRIYCHEAVTFH